MHDRRPLPWPLRAGVSQTRIAFSHQHHQLRPWGPRCQHWVESPAPPGPVTPPSPCGLCGCGAEWSRERAERLQSEEMKALVALSEGIGRALGMWRAFGNEREIEDAPLLVRDIGSSAVLGLAVVPEVHRALGHRHLHQVLVLLRQDLQRTHIGSNVLDRQSDADHWSVGGVFLPNVAMPGLWLGTLPGNQRRVLNDLNLLHFREKMMQYILLVMDNVLHETFGDAGHRQMHVHPILSFVDVRDLRIWGIAGP
mmetsp:Transcript_24165/g.41612  ORF Transcript_24165/g.41612 Transcript_24165/m.41612 type:complete len:253 (+) Transcript_24165:2-760(+)